MAVNIKAKLLKKEELKPGIFKFSVQADEIIKTAKPGNFIEIRVNDDIEPFLRRPISIHNMDRENGVLEFIFQEKGKGTKILSTKREGEIRGTVLKVAEVRQKGLSPKVSEILEKDLKILKNHSIIDKVHMCL